MSDNRSQMPSAVQQLIEQEKPANSEPSRLDALSDIVSGGIIGSSAGAAIGAALGSFFLPVPLMVLCSVPFLAAASMLT